MSKVFSYFKNPIVAFDFCVRTALTVKSSFKLSKKPHQNVRLLDSENQQPFFCFFQIVLKYLVFIFYLIFTFELSVAIPLSGHSPIQAKSQVTYSNPKLSLFHLYINEPNTHTLLWIFLFLMNQ